MDKHTSSQNASIPNRTNGDVAHDADDVIQNGVTASDVALDDSEEEDLRCGYRSWRPDCLQVCNTSRFLLASVCWFAFVQGFVVNGINNVNTATIERRFDLPSASVALITSAYDICAGFMAIFLGYIGTFVHIGKILTIGGAFMGAGSFFMFLPQLLVGPYELGQKPVENCEIFGNSTICDAESSSLSNYIYLFMFGQILHGVGGAALYTLSPTYLDENTKQRNTPLYLGCMQSFAALGPAVGYIFGGLFLSIYVDAARPGYSPEIELSPSDPRWVGAWWIGFLISSFAGFSIAIIMGCYPREIPAAKIYRTERVTQSYKGAGERETAAKDFGRSCKDVMYSFKLILTNPSFIFLTCAGIVESGAVVAFATFFPKIMQFQFGMSPGLAAMVSGALVVPGAAGGQILGGLIPRWFKLQIRGMMVQNVVCGVLGLGLVFCLLLRCDTIDIAGVHVPYYNSLSLAEDPVLLVDTCNMGCNCTTRIYEPICGVDGMEYFSSCHAGCLSSEINELGDTIYHNCSCINSANATETYDAVRGTCKNSCSVLGIFMPLFFILILTTFVSNTSTQACTLRSVPDKERSFAFGIQSTTVRFLGAVPLPIIMGRLFDKSCLIWQDQCGEVGSCWIYDSKSLSFGLTMINLFVKGVGLIFFCCALYCYKPPTAESIETRVTLNGEVKAISDSGSSKSIDKSNDITTSEDDVTDEPALTSSLLASTPS